MKLKRIYSFDLLKFILAIEIALSHYATYLPGVGTAVEFFFILSGFFMARKYFTSEKEGNVLSSFTYTKEHLKTLYPHYLFSLAIIFIYPIVVQLLYCIKSSSGLHNLFNDVIYKAYNLIPEACMLQNVGIYPGGLNYPLWQMTILIIASHFIYTLLRHNSRLAVNLICPLLSISIYALLNNQSLSIDAWGTFGAFSVPLLRGIAPLCIGVCLYKISEKLMPKLGEKTPALLLNIASIVAVFCLFFFGAYNSIHLIVSSVIILALYNEKSWLNIVFNRRCFKNLGRVSYPIYLNHAVLILFFKDATYFISDHFGFDPSDIAVKICFTIVLTAYSVLTLFIVDKITGRKKPLKNKN